MVFARYVRGLLTLPSHILHILTFYSIIYRADSHSQSFKEKAVRMVLESSARPIACIAREINVNKNTLYGWVYQSKKENFTYESDSDIHFLRIKLNKIQTENEQLRKECTILKQTASFYFNHESGV